METLQIKNLNTLSCIIDKKKRMKCIIHSLGKHNGKEILNVYSIGGQLALLSGGEGKVWVKTTPLIGQDTLMIIDERVGEPWGKDITIMPKPKPK